jgi:hypothetical protein
MDNFPSIVSMESILTHNLAEQIQRLLSEREAHETAIAAIDSTFARVSEALALDKPPRRGRPRKSLEPAVKAGKGRTGKRKRRTFAVTGEQLVLQFVKSEVNPKSWQIEAHWKNEGRSGLAGNTLSKLVKENKLKRIPIKTGRGSRYVLP